MDIFLYNDYRLWLKDSLEEVKKEKPFASMRYVCLKSGLDSGNFVRILQGKIHLSKKGITELGNFFGLNNKEYAFFEQLVLFSKAKTDKEAWQRFERLQIIKGVDVRTLADNEFEFFQKWYHAVVRSLISIIDFKNENGSLAKMVSPSITSSEVEESVKLLQRLKMIKKDEKGCWKVTEQFIGTGQKWIGQAQKEFHSQTLNLALESLMKQDPDLNNFSTITLTLPLNELPLIKNRIKEFRQELLTMAKGFVGDDSVYQFNMSLFPVGFTNKRKKK